jgi:hypothetical protein
MESILGYLAFMAFVVAQVAAVIAVHAERNTHQSDDFEAVRLDPRARAVWDSGG